MRLLLPLLLTPLLAAADNPIEQLNQRLASGEVKLTYRDDGRGYLDSLLEALDVSPLTQTLVFSKTSAQFRLITPRSPRAIYFNDDVYVGWVRGGPILEISTSDPEAGALFYTLDQRETERPRLALDSGQCLQCHESRRTEDVPGHLTRSVFPAPDGQPVFRLGTTDVRTTTPVAERFGGWYVTGTTTDHQGNRILPADDPADAQAIALDHIVRFSNYLRDDSDITAHLVLTHQTEVHNRISHAAAEARKALDYRKEMTARFGDPSPELQASVKRRVEKPAEELLRALLGSEEADLTGVVAERSEFAETFSARGPLFELDLETRLLRTPISYLILSASFDSLPDETLAYMRRRLHVILAGEDDSGDYDHLTAADRAGIRKLLAEYKPSLLQ